MSISGKPESGGKPRSTADIAAAARRSDMDRQDEPVAEGDGPHARESALPGERDARRRDARHVDDRRVDDRRDDRVGREPGEQRHEALEPLFTPDLAETYRLRWTSIQSGFVDDPRDAVRHGDELVAEIITNLADSFSHERHRLETRLDESGEGTTENLRVALRRYRSFFERLLSL